MDIKTNREHLLPASLMIGGVVERRQTLPILSNLLVQVTDSQMMMTATDLEVEIRTLTVVESEGEGEFTLPARKFIEICKALPEGVDIDIYLKTDKAIIKALKSRFTLSVLPAVDYPTIETGTSSISIELNENMLKELLDSVAFSMAQQDVRYYLNGMLMEIENGVIRVIATDGHRLAKSEVEFQFEDDFNKQILLPRKAVMELSRLLNAKDSKLTMQFGTGYVRFNIGSTLFTSKLIDGKFPDYERVIPKNLDKTAIMDRDTLKNALSRASILSGDKYKGIRMTFDKNLLKLQAHNPEQEEAEEEINIDYDGISINIGFNVGYILDILNTMTSKIIAIDFLDHDSSAVFRDPNNKGRLYVVMPMRL